MAGARPLFYIAAYLQLISESFEQAMKRIFLSLIITVMAMLPAHGMAACSDPPAPHVNWLDCDKRGADLHGADLSGAILTRTRLAGADLHEARLSGADLNFADLQKARLSGALLD